MKKLNKYNTKNSLNIKKIEFDKKITLIKNVRKYHEYNKQIYINMIKKII